MSYINKRQERLFHLSKVALRKFWWNVLVRKTKDNHSIPLENWDNYLKKLYDSPKTMGTVFDTPIKEYIFSFEDIYFRINNLANGKVKDIEGYQVEVFKIGISILIPHLHLLLNLVVKHGIPKMWM